MNFINALMPANQNAAQRIGFAVALISIILIVFLHSPIDGYNYEIRSDRVEHHLNSSCSQKEIEEMNRFYWEGVVPPSNWKDYTNITDSVPKGYEKWDVLTRLNWQSAIYKKFTEMSAKCNDTSTIADYETLPFSEWASLSPLVWWLGSVVHLISALTTIIVIAGIWLYVFHGKPNNTI